jgi:hypothetical protein
VLEADHNIISVSHHNHITLSMMLSPMNGPQVKYIMQIYVGHYGAKTPPLWRTFVCLYLLAGFQYTRVEPFLDWRIQLPSATESNPVLLSD